MNRVVVVSAWLTIAMVSEVNKKKSHNIKDEAGGLISGVCGSHNNASNMP
jgi:hypothetical protein